MKTDFNISLKHFAVLAKIFARAIGRIMSALPPRSMPSNCVNINALLLHLCDFDQATYRYVIKWLALPLQYPGTKMQYALLVNGPQGTGASLFFERVVGSLYGHAAKNLTHHDLHPRFNAWALGARFITIDGNLTRSTLAALKALVTESSVKVSQRALPDRLEANQMNLVFITSSPDFMPEAAHCDRRFMVIEAPPKRERLFYLAVAEEIDNGGAAAFRDYLLHRVDLSDFNRFSEPPTLATRARLECVA